MEDVLFTLLEPICDTYFFEIPKTNTSLPVIRFYPLTENYSYIADDKQDGKVKFYTVDVYSKAYDTALFNQVEEALKEIDHLYIQAKRTSKEMDVFFVSFDLEIFI